MKSYFWDIFRNLLGHPAKQSALFLGIPAKQDALFLGHFSEILFLEHFTPIFLGHFSSKNVFFRTPLFPNLNLPL